MHLSSISRRLQTVLNIRRVSSPPCVKYSIPFVIGCLVQSGQIGGAVGGHGSPRIWAKPPDLHYRAPKPRFGPPIFFHGAPYV